MNAAQIVAAAAEGAIRGLYVVGENPMETYPDRALLEKALAKLEFLVVQDMFVTSTAKMANAVLPVASFLEKTGTFTSAERRIQRLVPVVKQRVGKSDLEVFSALSAVMGKPAMTYAGPRQVMDEIAGLVSVYGGVSYDRIGSDGISWPCADAEDPGRKVLYEGGFPGGKAKLLPAPALCGPAGDGLPMYLIVGALKFHSGSFSEWSPSLMDVCPEAVAEMNLADMDRLGLDEGDAVRIRGASGAWIQVKVKSTRRPLPGTIVVPQHFSAVQLNRLTSWDTPVVKVKVDKV
jgi:predicted molibdopterin-dependent oxidoreductase YjgC